VPAQSPCDPVSGASGHPRICSGVERCGLATVGSLWQLVEPVANPWAFRARLRGMPVLLFLLLFCRQPHLPGQARGHPAYVRWASDDAASLLTGSRMAAMRLPAAAQPVAPHSDAEAFNAIYTWPRDWSADEAEVIRRVA
jgi:hypothetical protein